MPMRCVQPFDVGSQKEKAPTPRQGPLVNVSGPEGYLAIVSRQGRSEPTVSNLAVNFID